MSEATYQSGISGKAEVRFGGKIGILTARYPDNGIYGLALAEFYEKSNAGEPPVSTEHHDPQVFLLFDNMKSLDVLENAIHILREDMKREAERKHGMEHPSLWVTGKKLRDCKLSVRTLNICLMNGLEYLGDLTKIRRSDWLKFRNSGKKSLAELDDLLKDNGLDWAR